MNRYPVWKYVTMLVALLIGLIYTLPNFFGEAPAVQVSPAKTVAKVDQDVQDRVLAALTAAQLQPSLVTRDEHSLRVRFESPDVQIKARDVVDSALNPDSSDPSYTVALNLISRSPAWLTALRAYPMYLGLDLRGGVHFLMQVDMAAALKTRLDTTAADVRSLLREKTLRYEDVSRQDDAVGITFNDTATADRARAELMTQWPVMDVTSATVPGSTQTRLTMRFKPQELFNFQEQALKQNIQTLHNRINALGVAEPVIQQQGLDRIVVQLPGVQDTAKAKEILGRTATLEMRMVDESAEARAALVGAGPVPFGSEKFPSNDGGDVILYKHVLVTGESLTDAQPGFDQRDSKPQVSLTLDAKGGAIMRDNSRRNIGKLMAILLFEKGKGQAISVATIQGELGSRFQISGSMTPQSAVDLALLLRAGSLAAPMEIVEERTIGPSLGAENIAQGFRSVAWGFLAVVVFMMVYYHLFGVFSAIALGINLLLLVAVLSMLQATLTLPGMAAMALALGMAIDANVLINERVREELRSGVSPQAAIHSGYDSAWATILDSNITSLIAGLALLAWGTGPVRGFAVVHCLGIVTSMFSAVFFSRGLVNLWYGRQRKLKHISIGTVWKAEGVTDALAPSSLRQNKQRD